MTKNFVMLWKGLFLGTLFFFQTALLATEDSFDCLKDQPFADAISFEKTDCSDAYDMAASLMTDFKEKRKNKIEDLVGTAFNNALLKDIDDMANIDFFFSYFNKDYGQGSQCSLTKALEEFPCLKNGNENLKLLSGGAYENVEDLFTSIGQRYANKVSGRIESESRQCLNPFLRKKIYLDQLLSKNADSDLLKLALSEREGALTSEEIGLSGKLFSTVLKFDDNFELEGVTGETLKEQLASLIEVNQDKFSKNSIETCQKMIARVSGMICRPITRDRIDNPAFNALVFEFESEVYDTGFDEIEAELSTIGPEKSYAHFVLNCQPECTENCEKETSIDDIITDYFPEGMERHFFYEDQQESVYQDQSLDDELCPLLACSNGLEVQKGESCQKLETPRTFEEIKSYLNCSEDQYCKSDRFESFSRLIEESQNKAHPSMTAFTQTFLGESFSPQIQNTNESGFAVAPPPLQARVAEPEVMERASARLESKGNKSTPKARVAREKPGLQENNSRSVATTPEGIPYSPSTTRGEDYQENDYGRDLYRSMGEILRGAVDVQEKNNRVYNENLEEMVRSNRDLERRIQERFGEGNTLSPHIPSPKVPFRSPLVTPAQNTTRHNEGSGWNDALARNRRLNEQWDRLNGQSSSTRGPVAETFETNPGRPQTSVGTSEGTAGAEAAALSGAGRGLASLGPSEDRVEGVAGIGASTFNRNDMKAIDTNISILSQMDQGLLLKEGLNLDEPFLIRVKVDERMVVVPVKPFLYKGQKMLAPVLDHENWILGDVLRKSPLFLGYYQYEQERQKQLSLL